MAEYNIGDKFVVEIISKTDEPLAPYISSQAKNVTVYQLKGIPFMLDADTLSNFGKYEERKKGKWEWYNCVWVCSCCGKNPTKGIGYVQSKEQLFPFCPYCGADMRGET